MPFGERLKEARLRKGYTQTQLAKKLNIAGSTVTGYEKNNSEPSMLMISKIIDTLGVDANFLLQDEANQKNFENTATPEEFEKIIKKYRALDEHGKEVIETILNLEYRRCQYQMYHPVQIAARGGQRVKANQVDNLDELLPSKDTDNI